MTHLVFIGGGHSNAIALKMWGIKKIVGVQVTLISNVKATPYSGMLPGYIGGYYSWETTHINLEKLAKFAQVKLIIDQVIDINPEAKKIICQSGKIIHFDLLSIDIGSTPKQTEIKNAKLYTIPAKPVPFLLKKWQEIIAFCEQKKPKSLTLSIIGGGAGGIELALNMHQRLMNTLCTEQLNINLIHRGKRILSDQNQWASNQLTQILHDKKINLYLQTEIKTVTDQEIITKSGKTIYSNYTFLVTQADAPSWLKNNKISTDQEGFILIKNTLQTMNYEYIFATGDIATMINYPCPKAGVFAVRQGKPLSENIYRYLNDQPLKIYKPQQKYLNIIGIGDKKAVAIWGDFSCKSTFLWYWKEYLDLSFMNQFNL